MSDVIDKFGCACTYYLFNNEYETLPSLLGDNLIDLVYQARDLGMTFLVARYQDRVERYKIVDRNKNELPHLLLLESIKK